MENFIQSPSFSPLLTGREPGTTIMSDLGAICLLATNLAATVNRQPIGGADKDINKVNIFCLPGEVHNCGLLPVVPHGFSRPELHS